MNFGIEFGFDDRGCLVWGIEACIFFKRFENSFTFKSKSFPIWRLHFWQCGAEGFCIGYFILE